MTAGLGHDVHGPEGAPVVVLGSSLGTDRRMWDPQLEALAQRYRVVRYDHRGHGASEVPAGPYGLADLAQDVLALLDSLGVERFTAGGLSLGGMVSMWLAAHVPDRVEKLALFCTSAYLPPLEGWLDRAATVRADGTGAIADAVVARWFTPGFAAARPEVVAAHRAMVVGTPAEGYAGCCEAIAAMDLRDALAKVTAPALVVATADDPATPQEHARTIAAYLPDDVPTRVEVVPGAHLGTVESADVCTRLLLEHLAG
ncbi:3-oxoadipate enol-lactonase [Kineosporia sp. A_224]|uniref:3-oxoadipate enol-lactonase n=1 Tax=Kineosporia sp. A_224 TaxID=1962180 RepID=UPI000B4B43CF|nr:3-oxoadipate enol-lactonase [Kineosporia sp. A_224]